MGSGKTHLGRRLGTALRAPTYELDLGVDVASVIDQPRWVTEGIYLWRIDAILAAADVVVWLDLPYRTCVRRIVVRHAMASARRNNRYPGLRKLWKFASGSRWYWKTVEPRAPNGPTDYGALTRAQTIVTIEPYWSKVVRLQSPREVHTWFDGLFRNLPQHDKQQ